MAKKKTKTIQHFHKTPPRIKNRRIKRENRLNVTTPSSSANSVEELKQEFGSNWKVFAKGLLRRKFVVYEHKSPDSVRYLTLADFEAIAEDHSNPDENINQNDVDLPISENQISYTTDEEVENPSPMPKEAPQLNLTKKTKCFMPVPSTSTKQSSTYTNPNQNTSPASTSSESNRRSTRKRKIAVLYVDSDSEQTHDPETGSKISEQSQYHYKKDGNLHKRRKQISDKYRKYNLEVTVGVRNKAIHNHSVLKHLKNHYEAITDTPDSKSSIKQVTNNLAIACKIMQFCSPDHTIQGFHWQHLTPNKVDHLTNVLRQNIGLSVNTIANFHKVIRHLCSAADKSYPNAKTDLVLDRITELTKLNCKDIRLLRETQQSKYMQAESNSNSKSEEVFIRVFELFAKVRIEVKELLERAKDETLDTQEIFRINGFFNLHNLVCGNRPMVFQSMKKEIFMLVKNCTTIDRNGNKYFQHVTRSESIYYTEELMNMLTEYYENVRKPQHNFTDFLFINNEGKNIYNASSDLTRFIGKYDKDLAKKINYTGYKQIVKKLGLNLFAQDLETRTHATNTPTTSHFSLTVMKPKDTPPTSCDPRPPVSDREGPVPATSSVENTSRGLTVLDQLKKRVGKVNKDTPLPTNIECEAQKELDLKVQKHLDTLIMNQLAMRHDYMLTWKRKHGLKPFNVKFSKWP